jgi:hypothetical protein
MTKNINLVQGVPDRRQMIDLLSSCFNSPHDQNHIRWNYDQYPGFAKDHVFYIEDGGNLVALRRLYQKELQTPNGPIEFFVGGDTCVRPHRRGVGMFSKLLKETRQYEKEINAPISASFNRVGSVTYKAKIRRDWNYQTLPLHLRILSPEAVIPEYAQLAFEDIDIPELILSLVKSRLVSVGCRLLPAPIIAALVEAISSNQPSKSVRHLDPRDKHLETGTVSKESLPLSDTCVAMIVDLYNETQEQYNLYFRRNQVDIEHMLNHPSLNTVLLAKCDGTVVGFAPIIVAEFGAMIEARVLDIISRNKSIHQLLVDRIEHVAHEANADLITMVSEHDPGRLWAQIDKQVMMWDTNAKNSNYKVFETPLIGFYDIV